MKRKPADETAPRAEKTYHHGDLRRALLDATLPLVQTHGVQGFTLRQAARAAGVSHNAPYRHFPSRAHLLVALATEGQEALLKLLTTRLAGAINERARLDRLGGAYVDFARSREALFRVMFSGEVYSNRTPELAAAQARTFQFFREELRRAESAGLIRPGHADRGALVGWSAIHGATLLLLDGVIGGSEIAGKRSPRQLARLVIEIVLSGLSADATPAPAR
ncbi:MAG TPA: TetR/AcrR family transcriptional regulator [Planctomycetaceae bacterium]|nr:TetR/AcrR family transcriptional regulator [Planctomycetaceae bacterium]